MLKQYWRYFAIGAVLFSLFGCQNLGQYSLSEQTINNALQHKLNEYTQNYSVSNLLKLQLGFDNIDLDIGDKVANKVNLSGKAKIKAETLLGSQNASVQLDLNALPEFNKDKGAIYLKDIEIIDYQLDSSLGAVLGDKAFLPYLNQLLQLYFNQYPIYTLDKSNRLEYMAINVASHIRVEQGRIAFSLK